MQLLLCLFASLCISVVSTSATTMLRNAAGQLAKDAPSKSEALADALASCRSRPSSHICDPGELLSPTSLAEISSELQHFATPEGVLVAELSQGKKVPPPACPAGGYEAYVALLDVPAEDVRATAAALGHRWGVLGGECSNGIVALYSASEKVLAISGDRRLEDRVLTPQVEGVLERSSLGLSQPSPNAVVSALVTKLSLALHGEIKIVRPTFIEASGEFLLYGLTSCAALAAGALILCCFYDTASQWHHRARFHSCKRKVQCVHEVLLSRHGDLPLCPHCVEFVSDQPSPQAVVFLCGHRFHMDCVNRNCGACPICQPQKPVEDSGNLDGEWARSSLCTQDEAKPFFLRSLSRQYPEIIDQECVQRWRECHTEIWLSELNCPRYASVFQYQK